MSAIRPELNTMCGRRVWLPLLVLPMLAGIELWLADGSALQLIGFRALLPLLIVLMMLGNASGPVATAATCMLGVFYATQLMNHGYYGASLQPELMPAILNESHDILLALAAEPAKQGAAMLVATLLVVAILLVQRHAGRLGALPVWLLIVVLSLHALAVSDMRRLKPRQDLTLFENMLRAYQGFFFHSLPAFVSGSKIRYVHVDERIARHDRHRPQLVMLILGESISAQRMSVFGYAQDTTPQLRRLHAAGDVSVREGLSAATSTVSAVTALLLTLNDPRDINGLSAQNGNLFRLARQAGFQTHYWSAQRANVVDRVDLRDVADFRSIDNDADLRARGELALPRLVDGLPGDVPHFVVVHLRVGHAPYDYASRLKSGQTTRDPNGLAAYEQAVTVMDDLLTSLVAQVSGRFADHDVYFTSDHGELFGEEGLVGHAMLSQTVARVPIAIWSGGDGAKKLLGLPYMPNHYDLARAVADSLGFDVQRSGDGVGYINGIGFAGSSGLLHYDRKTTCQGVSGCTN